MDAPSATAAAQVEPVEFRCPLSTDASGRCGLFEVALAGGRITCRYLERLTTADGFAASRCLIGTAKARRDHLA